MAQTSVALAAKILGSVKTKRKSDAARRNLATGRAVLRELKEKRKGPRLPFADKIQA